MSRRAIGRLRPDHTSARPETGPAQSLTAPRSALALLADRTFGPYFAGNLASNIGTWFQQITAAVVVFDVTGSTFMVGLVGVAQFLPSLLLAPWTGAAADRFDRRRLLIVAQSIAAAAASALAVTTIAFGVDRFPVAWPVLVTALVVGLAHAVSTPAQQALVTALVPVVDLDQAVALNSVTFHLARAVGPAVGAFVLVAWGPGPAFAVNAVSYAALVTGLVVIRPRPIDIAPRTSVWVGFRRLRTDPILAMLLVGLTALGFGADPMITLSPALAEKLKDATFPNPDALVGILISAFGTGAVVGTLVVTRARMRWGHIRVATGGLALVSAGLAMLGLARGGWTALTGMAIAGAGYLFGVTSLTTAMHLRVPEGMRGRIMALWGVAFLGSRPVAALVDGSIADLASPEVATLVAAGTVAVSAIVMRIRVPADLTSSRPPG